MADVLDLNSASVMTTGKEMLVMYHLVSQEKVIMHMNAVVTVNVWDLPCVYATKNTMVSNVSQKVRNMSTTILVIQI